ncbi:putative 2-oxoglutarate and Fe(II)-dependent oxygenase superfamily protein [Melia azedarach]|uniref:2-oxoglutarate and Fe(II)-dependent oxygenase superfamily protein n=1 Tax=Melia azedarach TaxID=155640 RepID=A0ACC1Y1G2_MELAZ|nr:putative 2-oxoglutarate and Fe(II)-dependent oxygenase superfamily protein [Melia azedarach]
MYKWTATSTPQTKMASIKALTESPGLTSIPSSYTFIQNPNDHQAASDPEPEDSIPTIDFSLLNSSNPDERSKVIRDLGKACRDWGFFMVINHGVEESLMERMVDACKRFFDLTEEEKKVFEGKHVLDPIRCGTSFNASVEKVLLWRDFLKVFVHPEFHSPNKPTGFSEISQEYCKRTQEVARKLLRGISESLGLESSNIDKAMNLDSGFQVLIANLYPPCPQPDLVMGIPPHSDHGLLTLLTQNGIGGLQLLHNGKWVNVNALSNSFLVNTGDHVEILSNGKYKSVVHRAVVNNKITRLSLAIAHGPSLDTVVSPAKELIDNEGEAPSYLGMKYKEYLELQQSNPLHNKTCLDRVRI